MSFIIFLQILSHLYGVNMKKNINFYHFLFIYKNMITIIPEHNSEDIKINLLLVFTIPKLTDY
jgi:hypothetical protein